jgi:hypothetical protein
MTGQKLIAILVCGMIGAVVAGLLSGAFEFGGTWLVGLGAGLGVLTGLYLSQKRPENPAE